MYIGKNTTNNKSFSEILNERGIAVETVGHEPIQDHYPETIGKYTDPKNNRTKFFYEIHEIGFDHDAYVSYIFYDLQPTYEQIAAAIKDSEKFSSCKI